MPADNNHASLELTRVGAESDSILRNLYEHYVHDMSEWLGMDVQADGRFAYDTAQLWQNEFSVYLARKDNALVGFAVVGSAKKWLGEDSVRDVKDFFVLRGYRRRGIAESMAHQIWNELKGPWLVRVLTNNRPAVPFWRRAIRNLVGDSFAERSLHDHGRDWIYLRFDNSVLP